MKKLHDKLKVLEEKYEPKAVLCGDQEQMDKG